MATPILKIATFHPNSLGALVASFPALVALRESFPGAHLCSLVRSPLVALLRNFGAINEAEARPGGGLSSQAALMAKLRAADYDLALSFSQGSNALLLTWATGADVRAGFVPSRFEGFLTHRVEKNGVLTASAALDLAAVVGAHPRGGALKDFFALPPESLLKADKIAADLPSGWLLVVPQNPRNAARKNERDEWERVWKMQLRELAMNWPLVVAAPRPLGFAPLEGHFPLINVSGKTDAVALAALCVRTRAVIGDDDGALALAKLLEKPVVEALADDLAHQARLKLGL